MTDTELRERAAKRVKDRMDFKTHLIVYVAVNALIFGVNFATSPEYLWAIWPLMGWGVGLAIHGGLVFLKADDPDYLEELTEREMERMRKR